MQAKENLKTTVSYLPGRVRQSVLAVPEDVQNRIQEIRLRAGKPVCLTIGGKEQYLAAGGEVTDDPRKGLLVSREEIARSFQAVCSYSVYSHDKDVSDGYVTIRGGCRVGICGTAVLHESGIQTLRFVSSLNFRIAGEYRGAAEAVFQQVGCQKAGILVAGTVGSGKTTFLRDLCRIIGNTCRTALIDERGELAASMHGEAQNDVGRMTDVLDGYPRAAGILTALRVLSPSYIICDEISTMEDGDAILQVHGCGVSFAASCHAGSAEDLRRRPVLAKLLEAGVFQYCVLLGNAGQVLAVRRLAQR